MSQTPRRVTALSIALFSLGLFTACAQAQYPRAQSPGAEYSRGDIRAATYSRTSLRQAKRALADYRNQSVRWGGIIASVENRHGETWIEIVEQPLDWRGRPEADDDSAGRFIAILPGFADPAIYRVGREITVVGRLLWPYTRRIGEQDYSYALLDTTAHELWDAREERERIVYRTYRSYRTVDVYDPWFYPWPVYPRVYYEVHHHHHVHFPRPPVIIVQPPPVVVLPPHPGTPQPPAAPPFHPRRGRCLQEDRADLRCEPLEELPQAPLTPITATEAQRIAEDTAAPTLTTGQLFPEDGQAQVQPVATQPPPPLEGGPLPVNEPPALPPVGETPPVAGPEEPEDSLRTRRLDEADRLRELPGHEGGGKRPLIPLNEDPRPPRPAEESLRPTPATEPVRELQALPDPVSEPRPDPEPRPEPLPEYRSEPEQRPEPQPEYRSEPEPRYQPQPQPEYRSEPEPRPEPIEYRSEPAPAYEPRSEPMPSYQPAPEPQPSYSPPPQPAPSYTLPEPEPQPEPRRERESSEQPQ